MDENKPKAVQLFETLFITSLVIGFVHGTIIFGFTIWDIIFVSAPILVLTLLISRKRKRWARFVLAVLSLGGLCVMIAMPQIILGTGYPFVTLIVSMCQIVGLSLIFTKPASTWLNMPN